MIDYPPPESKWHRLNTFRMLYELKQCSKSFRIQATCIRGPEMIHVQWEKIRSDLCTNSEQKTMYQIANWFTRSGIYLPNIQMHSVLHKIIKISLPSIAIIFVRINNGFSCKPNPPFSVFLPNAVKVKHTVINDAKAMEMKYNFWITYEFCFKRNIVCRLTSINYGSHKQPVHVNHQGVLTL